MNGGMRGRVHSVTENSTDDEKTVEKLAEKRKGLWAGREKNGEKLVEREIGAGGSGASRGRECMAVARAGWKGMSQRGR